MTIAISTATAAATIDHQGSGVGPGPESHNTASQAAHQRLGFREIERTITYLRPL